MDVITAGGLSALFLEAIKWGVKLIIKNPSYDFPSAFYLVMIPVLNVLMLPLLALLQIGSATMPTDWIGFARTAVVVLISSLISVFGYDQGIRPLKTYYKLQKEMKKVG